MNGTSTSRTRLIAVVSALVVLAVIVLLVSHNWQQTVPVHTASVQYLDITNTVSTNGQVEPIQEFQAHASTPGMVEKVYVDLNQKVAVGQPLIRMEDADAEAHLANTQANLATAEAMQHNYQQGGSQIERTELQAELIRANSQMQDAQKSLAAAQAAQKTGALSLAEVAQAQQRFDSAQTNVTSIRLRMGNRYTATDLAQSKAQVVDAQAAIRAANGAVAHADIRSPIAGTVYARSVSQYDYVTSGDELLKVADLNHLRVRAYFDEPDIGKLVVGQPVTIEWEAMRGKVWHGHVEVTPTTVKTYTTRHVGECLITVDDANGDLKPYANVTVTVTTSQLHHVLGIPHEALRTEGGGSSVFRVLNGRLVQTQIQVGSGNFTRLQVTGGLREGDEVALSAVPANRDLTEGMRITAVHDSQ